jgi:phosphate transport system permease protein
MTNARSFDAARYRNRRGRNLIVLGLSTAATAIGVAVLAAILLDLLWEGSAAIRPSLFTMMTPPAGQEGGLRNAIVGSLALTVVGTLLGTPVGIFAGTYLAEYSRGSRFSQIVQFINDILLSAPSIIIGLFIYQVMVAPFHSFSGWAGSAALAILVVPVVVRTTVDMLALVPNGLREAAAALGTPKWKIVTMVCYRAARQGMLTGVMLAVARISGETAPLVFTAFGNNNPSTDMSENLFVRIGQFWTSGMAHPMSNLPIVIYNFVNDSIPDLVRLAWGGALLITASVLCLNIGARALANLGSVKQ